MLEMYCFEGMEDVKWLVLCRKCMKSGSKTFLEWALQHGEPNNKDQRGDKEHKLDSTMLNLGGKI